MLLVLVLSFCLVPFPSSAADAADEAYQKARGAYRQLLDSPTKRLYRDNWMQVIDRLQAVAHKYPRHRRAPAALYTAGKASRDLYSISRRRADAEQAVRIFDSLAQRYPADSLADDALILAGEVLEVDLRDFSQAYFRYERVVEKYPSGDMISRARKKTAELRAYAPVRHSAPVARASAGVVELDDIRSWSNPGYTRIVLDLSGPAEFAANFLPGDPGGGLVPRLYVDIAGAAMGSKVSEETLIDDGLLRRIRTGRFARDTVRVVLDLHSFQDYKVFPLEDPFRIVIDVAGEGSAQAPATAAVSPQAPQSAAATQMERKSAAPLQARVPNAPPPGIRRIVVDPGHGGRDPGAIGPSGIMEKDVTLALARILARRLESELGCEVILTRNSDKFLPLEERTAIANKAGADLFISIHVNASLNREAHGIETYYLNFAKNEQAAAVAARENGTSLKQVGDLELILFDLMAHSKINESSRLAAEIQKSMVSTLGRHYSHIRDLGVRQGPFYVLLGATMPSVLVEAAFISNKREEGRLTDTRYHERTADAIVAAVRNYANSLKVIATR
jgi:N-acetylmuramoyl-L-alanine amidase